MVAITSSSFVETSPMVQPSRNRGSAGGAAEVVEVLVVVVELVAEEVVVLEVAEEQEEEVAEGLFRLLFACLEPMDFDSRRR